MLYLYVKSLITGIGCALIASSLDLVTTQVIGRGMFAFGLMLVLFPFHVPKE
jgi:hypothetical protein